MFSKHVGGEYVKGGIYWSSKGGEFISVPAEGGMLEGSPRDKYRQFPLLAVLIVGPIMGLAFAMFLPLSGVLVLVPFLVGKLRGAVSPSAAHMASSRLQPGVSYLEPRSKAGTSRGAALEDAGTEHEGKLINLTKEIEQKRGTNK